jgi:hypothetical protein
MGRRLDLSGFFDQPTDPPQSESRRRLSDIVVEGEPLVIEQDSHGYHCRSVRNGREVELTVEEQLGLRDATKTRGLGPKLRHYGIDALTEGSEKSGGDQALLETQMHELRSQVPRGLCVTLDATTVRNAIFSIDGRLDPSPLTLLDLSVVTVALICFDAALVQPFPGARDLQNRSDAFKVLHYPDRFIPTTLWSMCAGAMNDQNEVVEFEKAWSKLLQVGVKLDFSRLGSYQDSPSYWDGIPASYYHGTLLGSTASSQSARTESARTDSIDEFLSVQTLRALFNDQLAGFLALPYLATSLRSPIQSLLIARKIETQRLVDHMLNAVGPPLRSQEKDRTSTSPYMAECSAPFLLGIVLEKMRRPDDYWAVIREYRRRFAPLRERILLDRDKWQGRSGQYLEQFTKHLARRGSAWKEAGEATIDTTAAIGTTAATALAPQFTLVGAGIKLLKLIHPADKLHSLFLKCFRPEVYLLFNLADEARQLRTVETNISRIWGTTWLRSDHDQLEALASSHPEPFARLRSLAGPN